MLLTPARSPTKIISIFSKTGLDSLPANNTQMNSYSSQHLNSLTQDLQYTIEHPSTDGSLPYLDVLIHSDKSTSVYRKPTHTNLYTHYSSAAPSSTKNSIISSLTRRAYTICSPKHLKPELEFLKQTFLCNGYQISRISLVMQRTKQSLRKKKKPSSKTTPTSNIVIPFPAGRSKDLKRVLLRYDITASFSSPPTLMTLLNTNKKPGPKHSSTGIPVPVPVPEEHFCSGSGEHF